MDRVRAVAGDDEVGAGAGGDMRGARAGEVTVVGMSYGIVKSRSWLVVSVMSTSWGGRGEHERVAGLRPGTGRDCRIHGGETN